MAWIYLLLAGFLEVGWAVGLKQSAGFTRPVASAATLAAMAGSMVFLSLALRTLPMGTAYAFWTGIGTVGTVAVGIVALGEPGGAQRMFFLGLIVAGIAGLKMTHA